MVPSSSAVAVNQDNKPPLIELYKPFHCNKMCECARHSKVHVIALLAFFIQNGPKKGEELVGGVFFVFFYNIRNLLKLQ